MTLKDMIAFGLSIGKNEKQAYWDARAILSPRLSSKRGDCRGSVNTYGHLYYAEKLGRQVRAGVRDPQKFRLRWREVALKSRREEVKATVEQVKEASAKRVATKSKSKSKSKSKATVTA